MAKPSNPFAREALVPVLNGEPIAVLVGVSETKIWIHDSLMRKNSAFFGAALGKAWKESMERTIRLPEEDPDHIVYYAQWLYTGKLPPLGCADHARYERLASLYTMGGRLLDPDFQDAIIDAFFMRFEDSTKGYPAERAIEIIYLGTSAGDPARRLLVDCWAGYGSIKWLSEPVETISDAQFYYDLAKALWKSDSRSSTRLCSADGNTCMYHHHGNKQCYSKK